MSPRTLIIAAAALVAPTLTAATNHTHEDCGCIASHANWTVDCGAPQQVLAAYGAMITANCYTASVCSP